MGRKLSHRVCSLCEAMCGLLIETEDRRVVSIRSNSDDVLSHGAYCPKSQGLARIYEDPDRLTKPLKRTPEGFVEIAWEQAFTEIAAKVNQLQADHGTHAIATYLGNPNVHNTGSMLMLPLFLRNLRTRNKFSATSVDQLPHQLVALQMFGHQLLLPIADVDRTDFMLVIGANPAVSNGSLLSAPGLSSRLKAISKRGGRVVVIDPRYTETASLADEHLFIRPGSDAHFLATFLQVMLRKQGPKLRHLESHVHGLTEVLTELSTYSPDQLQLRTGISLETVEQLVEQFVRAPTALVYGRFGVSTQAYGTVCQWLIQLINIFSGNFDREGGVLFTRPAFDILELMARSGSRGSFARRRSRVRQLPDFNGEFPAATLADEILVSGPGQIRGLFTIAGNPVLSLPHGLKLETACEQLELHVAIDFYCNETSRLAHYILPPSSPLEHSHFDLVFNAFAVRNVARFSPAILPKAESARDDWDILLELWSRIGVRSRWQRQKRRSLAFLARNIGMEKWLDLGLRFGPYRAQKLSCKKLSALPNGIDLGALQPSVPQRLFTKDKNIHLIPGPLAEAWSMFLQHEQEALTPLAPLEFLLIGRRNLRSNNSWMHNHNLIKGRHPCYLLMHKSDAEKHGIEDGQRVQVRSAVGQVQLPVLLTDKIMPGVVSIPHGWGHGRSGSRLSKAQQQPGVSINDVMDDRQIDKFSGNAVLNGQRVQIVIE